MIIDYPHRIFINCYAISYWKVSFWRIINTYRIDYRKLTIQGYRLTIAWTMMWILLIRINFIKHRIDIGLTNFLTSCFLQTQNIRMLFFNILQNTVTSAWTIPTSKQKHIIRHHTDGPFGNFMLDIQRSIFSYRNIANQKTNYRNPYLSPLE